MLSPSLKDDWLCLENQLDRAFEAMHHIYPCQAFCPPLPHLFGFLCAHKRQNTLSTAMKKSKAWFGLYMAVLSFSITVAVYSPSYRKIPFNGHIDKTL